MSTQSSPREKGAPGSQNAGSKHRRRLSGSWSRRSSSAFPAADIPAAALTLLNELNDAERQQLADVEEPARFVVACNGNHAEASGTSCYVCLGGFVERTLMLRIFFKYMLTRLR